MFIPVCCLWRHSSCTDGTVISKELGTVASVNQHCHYVIFQLIRQMVFIAQVTGSNLLPQLKLKTPLIISKYNVSHADTHQEAENTQALQNPAAFCISSASILTAVWIH